MTFNETIAKIEENDQEMARLLRGTSYGIDSRGSKVAVQALRELMGEQEYASWDMAAKPVVPFTPPKGWFERLGGDK